jgi:hypothetical protein
VATKPDPGIFNHDSLVTEYRISTITTVETERLPFCCVSPSCTSRLKSRCLHVF